MTPKDDYHERLLRGEVPAESFRNRYTLRSLGLNQRALGTNPRALARNKWALRNWKRRRKSNVRK
jgi:hypothetical protein